MATDVVFIGAGQAHKDALRSRIADECGEDALDMLDDRTYTPQGRAGECLAFRFTSPLVAQHVAETLAEFTLDEALKVTSVLSEPEDDEDGVDLAGSKGRGILLSGPAPAETPGKGILVVDGMNLLLGWDEYVYYVANGKKLWKKKGERYEVQYKLTADIFMNTIVPAIMKETHVEEFVKIQFLNTRPDQHDPVGWWKGLHEELKSHKSPKVEVSECYMKQKWSQNHENQTVCRSAQQGADCGIALRLLMPMLRPDDPEYKDVKKIVVLSGDSDLQETVDYIAHPNGAKKPQGPYRVNVVGFIHTVTGDYETFFESRMYEGQRDWNPRLHYLGKMPSVQQAAQAMAFRAFHQQPPPPVSNRPATSPLAPQAPPSSTPTVLGNAKKSSLAAALTYKKSSHGAPTFYLQSRGQFAEVEFDVKNSGTEPWPGLIWKVGIPPSSAWLKCCDLSVTPNPPLLTASAGKSETLKFSLSVNWNELKELRSAEKVNYAKLGKGSETMISGELTLRIESEGQVLDSKLVPVYAENAIIISESGTKGAI